jgi:hypothetical protein
VPAAGWKRWVIDYDQPCPHCAYSLRGLRPKDRCPECGKEIPDYSVTEERHLLHRADRRFLQRLRTGAFIIICLPPSSILAVVAAGLGGSPMMGLVAIAVCILVWFGGWTLVASHDATLSATDPFNASARLCRSMSIMTVVSGAIIFVGMRLLYFAFFSSGQEAELIAIGIALAALWCSLVGLHAVVCISHKDAILWRAKRLYPKPKGLPGLVWILATLSGGALHLYVFTRALRLHRAATLALNAEPDP